jgi:hypothetical protein
MQETKTQYKLYIVQFNQLLANISNIKYKNLNIMMYLISTFIISVLFEELVGIFGDIVGMYFTFC